MLLSIKNKKSLQAFTLIELIIYIALLSLFLTAAISLTLNIIHIKNKSDYQQKVGHSLDFAIQKIVTSTRSSSQILVAESGNLCLQDKSGKISHFYIDNSNLYFDQDDCVTTSNPQILNSQNTIVTQADFVNLSTGNSSNISITLTVSTPTSVTSSWQSSQTYTTSVELRNRP